MLNMSDTVIHWLAFRHTGAAERSEADTSKMILKLPDLSPDFHQSVNFHHILLDLDGLSSAGQMLEMVEF